MAFFQTQGLGLASLEAQTCFDLGPDFGPAVIADGVTQGQHGVNMLKRPVHARTLEAVFHHQLVGALHHTTPDRPALGLKVGVLHLRLSFFEIGQRLRHTEGGWKCLPQMA